MWPCRQASAHCILYSDKALWRAAPPVESNQRPQWSTNRSPTGHTVHTELTEGCYCTADLIWEQSHTEGDRAWHRVRSTDVKAASSLLSLWTESQPVRVRLCECVNSLQMWAQWVREAKMKGERPLLHLRSFLQLCAAWKILCVLFMPMHGYLSAWGHNAPRQTLFKVCESWSAPASKDPLG